MTTRVVNLRREPHDVYIGRAGRGQDGYFGNPFAVREHGTKALDLYREHFTARVKSDPEFRRRVLELRGKTLGPIAAYLPCYWCLVAAGGTPVVERRDVVLDLLAQANADGECVPATWTDVRVALRGALEHAGTDGREGASAPTVLRGQGARRVVVFAVGFLDETPDRRTRSATGVVLAAGHSSTRGSAMRAARAAWPRLKSERTTRLDRWSRPRADRDLPTGHPEPVKDRRIWMRPVDARALLLRAEPEPRPAGARP